MPENPIAAIATTFGAIVLAVGGILGALKMLLWQIGEFMKWYRQWRADLTAHVDNRP